jgi:hypothetical protein
MAVGSVAMYLASPGKVAHALDWHKVSGSILSIAIDKDRINLAAASHPTSNEPVQHLPSVFLERETIKNYKTLKPDAAQELACIMRDFLVCGVVVSWPVQKEGWCGAPCGRVLHILDQLSAHSVMNSRTPICLWDGQHNQPPAEDKFGRAAIWSETSDKTFHQASKEQYEDHHDAFALNVWNDFCRAHWPELYQAQQEFSQLSWDGGNDRNTPSAIADDLL